MRKQLSDRRVWCREMRRQGLLSIDECSVAAQVRCHTHGGTMSQDMVFHGRGALSARWFPTGTMSPNQTRGRK